MPGFIGYMFNPTCWSKLKVPLLWAPIPPYMKLQYMNEIWDARNNREIELKVSDDEVLYWRRDLTEDRELGL
jgi:hypothetical protein